MKLNKEYMVLDSYQEQTRMGWIHANEAKLEEVSTE